MTSARSPGTSVRYGRAQRLLQQTSIAADDRHRRAVAPCEFVDAGIRTVEQTEAIGSRRQRQRRLCLTIHEDAVAEKAAHRVHRRARDVHQLIVSIERSVLKDADDLFRSRRQAQRGFRRIGDKRSPARPLYTCGPVRV